MTADNSSNRWAYLLLLVIALGLGTPVYEEVRKALEPSLGDWTAFGLGVLAALAVAFPVYFAANWIINRERNARADDLAKMVYRPAVLPAWVVAIALLKNLRELTEIAPWIYLGWLLLLLTGAVILQHRRARAWSWWVALPVGFVIGLVAIPATFGVAYMFAPSLGTP